MDFYQNAVTLIFIFLLFLFLCGTGLFFLDIAGIKLRGKSSLIVFSFGAGSLFFSLILLLLGRYFHYDKTTFAVITVIFSIFALFKLNLIFDGLKNLFREIFFNNSILINFLLCLIFIRLFYSILNIFIPPTGWDTLAYHYAIPAIYNKMEKIVYIPFMYHSNWPQNMEILFGYAMAMRNDLFANGICFLYAFLLLLTVYQFSKEISGKEAGIIAVALIISTTLFKREAVNGYVDIGLSFFEIAALYGVVLWSRTKDLKFLIVAAICAAGAASVKMLGIFSILVLPFFIAFADIFNNDNRKLNIKETFWFILFAAFFASPWYIKSFIDTGNPVWPFAYNLFGGKNWSKELADFRQSYYAIHGAGSSLKSFLILPYSLIKSSNMDGYLGNNFIFYYFLFPFLVFYIIKERKSEVSFLLFYSFIFIVFWFFNAQMIRFLFPGFVVITALNAIIIDKILFNYKNKILKVIIAGYLIFLAFYSFPFRYKSDYDGLKLLLGIENRENYLLKNLDCYGLIKKINTDENIKGKIVLIKEVRGYYLNKDYMWGDPVNQGLISYKNKNETLLGLKNNNIKYIFLNNNQYNNASNDGYNENVYKMIKEIINKNAKLVYCENNVCLYELIY